MSEHDLEALLGAVPGGHREVFPFWSREGAWAWAQWFGGVSDAHVVLERDLQREGEFGEWSVVVTHAPSSAGRGGGHGA